MILNDFECIPNMQNSYFRELANMVPLSNEFKVTHSQGDIYCLQMSKYIETYKDRVKQRGTIVITPQKYVSYAKRKLASEGKIMDFDLEMVLNTNAQLFNVNMLNFQLNRN